MSRGFIVLISSAGRRVSLLRAFRQALDIAAGAGSKVIACDASSFSAAMWDADARFVVPRCSEPDYIEQMLSLCHDQQVDLLIPTIDTELQVLSENRHRFEEIGTSVMVSGPKTIILSADKYLTHQFLEFHQLPTGQQAEVRNAPKGLEAWAFPLIAKPRSGSAGEGIRQIATVGEVADLPDDYIIEEIATGIEYTIDVFLDARGDAKVVVPRERVETRSGEVSKGVTARIPELTQLAKAVCEALPDAKGVITIQAFFDKESGKLHIVEINPRFGGGYPLSHSAGADFPLWLIQTELGQTDDADDGAWRDGLAMLRFDDAVFVDLVEVEMQGG